MEAFTVLILNLTNQTIPAEILKFNEYDMCTAIRHVEYSKKLIRPLFGCNFQFFRDVVSAVFENKDGDRLAVTIVKD